MKRISLATDGLSFPMNELLLLTNGVCCYDKVFMRKGQLNDGYYNQQIMD